ncbi:uncharacterized protein LOC142336557, partial [Convolutriloba macropyga]|uniref:uncharacterized protein LOC142336557 n=1 Tax=Convolutriloba macropyga TaxID=536237 RepID=UPI003F52751B
MKFHNNVPRGGNCLLDREYSAEEDSRRNWSSTDEKMSSSESPSSVMIYVQSLILLSLSYSYFSYYGWFTLDSYPNSPNGNPYYYLSPLRSCVFRATYSQQFEDFLQIAICQPTDEFAQHIIMDNDDEKVADLTDQVGFLARFMISCAAVSLIVYLLELFSDRLNRMFKISLASFSGAMVLVQFCAQMRLFAAMSQLTQAVGENIDKNLKIVGPEFDFEDDLGISYALGFFVALFGTCLYVGAFSYVIYRLIHIVLD